MSRLPLPLSLLLVFSAFVQPQAHAGEDSSVVPACPAGNLLAGKLPVAWQEIARDRALLTDETVATKARCGRVPGRPVRNRRLHRDLGSGRGGARALLAIQADANDTYNIWDRSTARTTR